MRLFLAWVAVGSFSLCDLSAQSFPTWQGSGTNWSDAANWSTAYGYGQLQWTGGGNQTSWNNSGTQSQWRFYFSGSQAYTLGGGQVNFFDYGGTNGGILSDSSATQSINLNVSFRRTDADAPMFILTRGSGGLTFGGDVEVTNRATFLGIGGSNTAGVITFNGSIGGSSSNAIVVGTNSFNGNDTGMGSTRAVFAGSNTYTGATVVHAGVLTVAHNSGLGSTNSGTTVRSGATLRLSNGITVSGEALSLGGTGVGDGGALVSASGNNAYLGLISMTNTAYVGADSGAQLTISNVSAGTNQWWVVGAGTTTVAGGATNSGSGTAFVKTNTGTAILMASNAWAGNKYIREGTVVLSNNNAMGSAGTIFIGATTNAATSALQIGSGIINSNAITVEGGGTGTRTLSYAANSGTGTQLGSITLNTNSMAINVASGGTMLFGGGITVNTSVGGVNRLAIDGGGTLIVTNNGSGISSSDRYQVRIGNGTLIIGSGTIISRTGVAGLGHGIDLGVDLNGSIVDAASRLYVSNGVTVSNAIYVSTTNQQARVIGMQDQGSSASATYSGPIGLANAGITLEAGTNAAVTVSGAITNFTGAVSNSLTKTGAGTVTLTGANNYGGGTLVSGGTLRVGNGGTTGQLGVGNVTNNGALVIDRSNNYTNSSDISGSGTLAQMGAGTLVLSGNNSYSGLTTISGGNLRLAGSGTTIAGDILINGGTLSFTNTAHNQIASTANITMTSGGFDVGTRTNTIASLTMSGGSVNVGSGNLLMSSATLTGGTLTASGTGSRYDLLSGATLGSVVFDYSNASGNNNAVVLGGNLTVNSGTTAQFSNSGGGAVRLNLNNAVRTFDVGSSGHLDLNWVVWSSTASAGGMIKNGAGTLSLEQANLFTGGFTLNSGVVRVGNDAALGGSSGLVTLNGGTLVSTDSTARTFANALVLGGDVTFGQTSGGTGALSFTSTTGINLGGTTRTLTTEVGTTIAGALTNGSITKAGGSTLTLGNTANNLANLNITAGTVSFLTNATVGGLAGSGGGQLNVAGGTLTVNTSTNSSFAQTISGAGSLVKSGSGTLLLSGSSSYSGGTTLAAGMLRVGGSTALGTGYVTQTSGASTLQFSNAGTVANDMSVYNVAFAGGNNTLSGSVTLNNTTYDTAAGTTNTLSGTLDGSGGITKTGDGVLVVAGTTNNTFTGNTDVQAGTLVLSKTDGVTAISSTNTSNGLRIASGATVQLAANDQINDAVGMDLDGGTFITGTSTTGFSEVLGTLTLNSSSIIDFGSWEDGAGLRDLNFADSSSIAWTGTLTITNWSQLTNSESGAYGRLYFGNSMSALTVDQLAQINFNIGGTLYGAKFLSDGEVVADLTPIPEPGTYAAVLMLLAAVGWRERRRLAILFRRG
ncbi:MAG: autotransporter-associated beta strand repeat-containing protein [Chthoniobacterales bacterium]|nr:autotransporter-associated beta strand repeat-containing protein [Chthoniobacterales bacterium]